MTNSIENPAASESSGKQPAPDGRPRLVQSKRAARTACALCRDIALAGHGFPLARRLAGTVGAENRRSRCRMLFDTLVEAQLDRFGGRSDRLVSKSARERGS